MADELALDYGTYVSGVYIGKEPFTYTNRDTGQVRTSYRWGIGDGTAHSIIVYVPASIYQGFSPMLHSNVVLRVRPFPSGKSVGFSLLGLAEGTKLFLDDGSAVTAKQIDALISASSGG